MAHRVTAVVRATPDLDPELFRFEVERWDEALDALAIHWCNAHGVRPVKRDEATEGLEILAISIMRIG